MVAIINPMAQGDNDMNHLPKSDFNRNRFGFWIRLTSVICIVVMVMFSCVGCTSYISFDEFVEWKNQLTSEIDSLKSNNEAAQQELDTLKSRYEAAQQEIDTLKSSYEDAQQEIASLKSSYEDALQKIASLENADEVLQGEIDTLLGLYEEAQLEIETLQDRYEAALSEMEQLKQQIENLQSSITPKIRIYIDQGHNPTSYHNSGAFGNGLYEQDVTYTIGCLVAQLLEKDGRFAVCLSRPTADTVLGTDNSSSLAARVKGAETFGADYFISLHTNAFESNSANGIEVYTAQQQGEAYALGTSLLQGLIASTGLRDRGMKLNPDLHVLKNATMPAVLVEMGFITNPADAALLSQSPELFAQGIYDGILAYFGLSK